MLGMEGGILEVLRDFLGRERGGSLVDRPGPKGILAEVSLSARQSSENLNKVPRIWEVEDPGDPR